MPERDVNQEILIMVTEINTKLNHIVEQQEDHEKRLRSLEGKPGKRWESVTLEVIIALLVGAVSFAFGKML